MEYVKLKDICFFLPKSKIKAGEGMDNGKYIFFTSSDTKVSKINEYLYDDEAVIIGTGGKPSCNYCKGKFSVSTDNFVLKSNTINIKYLYYFLRNNNLSILEKGFHGVGLKHISKDYVSDINVPLLDYSKQCKIVSTLDSIYININFYKDQLKNFDNIVKSQFIEMFSGKYRRKFLYQVCKELFAGGDIIKEVTSSKRDEKHPYPIYANGEKNNGLCGFTNMYRVDQEAVTISGRGTIGFVCLRNERFYPAVRLIVAIPNRQIINGCFLKHFIEYKNYGGQGASIPQLTVPMIRKELIPIPPIELQNQFASFVEQIDKSKYFGGVEYGIC